MTDTPRYRCDACGKRVQVRIAIGEEKAIAWAYRHNAPNGERCIGGIAVEIKGTSHE